MSSRQRMLTALNCGKPDSIPCSFMLFNGLKSESRDYLDFIQRQLDMGLDAYVQIPPRPPVVKNDTYNLHGLPVNYSPDVKIQQWKARIEGEEHPILIKEYHTPAGTLRAEVRQDPEWRWGDHVPFLDDYLVSRSRKFIVDGPEDLAALRYLLVPPTPAEIADFTAQSEPVLEFAQKHDLLIAGGWGIGADLIGWVFGLQRLPYVIFDDPDFVTQLMGIIDGWNRSRMEVVLKAGVDLYIKRAWYENCDYFTPRLYRRFIRPVLEADIALAHQYHAKLGYLMTSNCMPLLDEIQEIGVDVMMGVDPAQWNLEVSSEKLGGRVCLWGGVNGHLTIEMGSPDQVRAEVKRSLELFAPKGGFILSPVDNVREFTPTARQNVSVMIDEWKNLSRQHTGK